MTEEQKNQSALKTKNKVLKQTHDKKLAQIFSPITRELTEVIDSTKKLVEVFEKSKPENKTPNQLAIKNNQVAIENTHDRSHAGVLYEPSLEHTLTTMKTANSFSFEIE